MSAADTETASLSPECAVALRPGYEDLHVECRQTEDVPLPFATGSLLVRRCTCLCHGYNRQGSTQIARSSQVSRQPSLERDVRGACAALPAQEGLTGGTGSHRYRTTFHRRSSP